MHRSGTRGGVPRVSLGGVGGMVGESCSEFGFEVGDASGKGLGTGVVGAAGER